MDFSYGGWGIQWSPEVVQRAQERGKAEKRGNRIRRDFERRRAEQEASGLDWMED